jgi:hypothetical protein
VDIQKTVVGLARELMASQHSSADTELEQLRRCNQLLISMLCHVISNRLNGRTTISEESLQDAGSLQISQHLGRLVLTVGGSEPVLPDAVGIELSSAPA